MVVIIRVTMGGMWREWKLAGCKDLSPLIWVTLFLGMMCWLVESGDGEKTTTYAPLRKLSHRDMSEDRPMAKQMLMVVYGKIEGSSIAASIQHARITGTVVKITR